jgi:hypothetical protein
MEKMYEELERILACELEVQCSLVETAASFNKSIREDNLPDIQTYTIKHDQQICQIEKLEEQRIQYCVLIGKTLGLESREPRLASLIEKAPPQSKSKLSEIQVHLKKRIDDLSKLTISNRVLLENALNVINNTFSFLQQTQKKYVPYGTKKKGNLAYQGHTLINRTV